MAVNVFSMSQSVLHQTSKQHVFVWVLEKMDEKIQTETYTISKTVHHSLYCTCTFYKKGLLVVDIHETVGTGVAVASERVSDQLLPGGLGDRDVVVLHPATLMWVIDISPVVSCVGLAFVDQHRMKPVWNLSQNSAN